MAFTGFFGEPIIVRKRTKSGVDSDGNDVFTTSDTTVRGAYTPGGSSFAGAGTVEHLDSRDTVVAQPTAYLPPGTAIQSIDVLVIRGQLYEVDGIGQNWTSPFTHIDRGYAVPLKRVTG